MRVPAERRAELHAEALKRIALSQENDWRRYLLTECYEAYADLDDTQRQRLTDLLNTDSYKEVRPLMVTTYERGKIEGKIEGLRETALMLLEKKFGPLPAGVKQRIESLSLEELHHLLSDLIGSQSLKELHLGE
jgi:hypothetical protein